MALDRARQMTMNVAELTALGVMVGVGASAVQEPSGFHPPTAEGEATLWDLHKQSSLGGGDEGEHDGALAEPVDPSRWVLNSTCGGWVTLTPLELLMPSGPRLSDVPQKLFEEGVAV